MVTTKPEAESMEAGYENGFGDYVIKPFNRNNVVGNGMHARIHSARLVKTNSGVFVG